MLRRDAGVAELLDVLQPRQAAHHVLATQLAKRVEANVPIAGMPAPGIVVLLCREAHRACDVEARDVEPIPPTVHLGDEMALAIPDAQDAILNQHLRATLIELADTDDAVLQARNEVDVGERLVLTVLPGEQHRT
uniref:Uncharacterized protein n=1 Tax=Arundo donax TaxID=35708 RepID=A0A0A9DUI7_ARUDO